MPDYPATQVACPTCEVPAGWACRVAGLPVHDSHPSRSALGFACVALQQAGRSATPEQDCRVTCDSPWSPCIEHASSGQSTTLLTADEADALRRVLRQRGSGHCHSRPGIWDWDNGAKAGTVCTHCQDWTLVTDALGMSPSARGTS